MSWQEIIKKRRTIETMDQENVIQLKTSVEDYQLAIGTALHHLVPLERQVVGLRYLKDKTIACIANDTGMSWDGVHEVLSRGTENVLQFLKGSAFEYRSRRHDPPHAQAEIGIKIDHVINNSYLEASS